LSEMLPQKPREPGSDQPDARGCPLHALVDRKDWLAERACLGELLRARFDRIFKRGATGYVMLDRLLRRLFRHKDALLRVLERPEIPLNTNASEKGDLLWEVRTEAATVPAAFLLIVARRLPRLDPRYLVDQHEDVEREIITDGEGKHGLDRQCDRHRRGRPPPGGEREANGRR
jgi:hypothetical protein